MYTRITSRMMMNNYKSELNRSMSDLSSRALSVQNQRKYQNDYEDPVSATRAYQYRRELTRTEHYMENTKSVDSILTTRESVLMDLSSISTTINSEILGAITGTSSPEAREAYAQELDKYQEAIVQFMNTSYGNSFIFGGTSTNKVPYALEDDGTVTYRGVPVDGLTKTDQATLDLLQQSTDLNDDEQKELASLTAKKAANLERLEYFNSETQYVDLGFGLEINSDDSVNKNSAYNMISNGISFLGTGTDGNGNSQNFIQLIGDLSDAIRGKDSSEIDLDYIKELTDNFTDCMSSITMELTQLGSDMNFMDSNLSRLEEVESNLTIKINDTEYISEADAITAFEEAQYTYKASLQIGSLILTQSFLDYMS